MDHLTFLATGRVKTRPLTYFVESVEKSMSLQAKNYNLGL